MSDYRWKLQWPIKRVPKRVVIKAEWVVINDPWGDRRLPPAEEQPQLPGEQPPQLPPPKDVRYL